MGRRGQGEARPSGASWRLAAVLCLAMAASDRVPAAPVSPPVVQPPVARPPAAPPLVLGVAVTGELRRDEERTYILALLAGRRVRITALQQGVDLHLGLTDPLGQTVAEADEWIGLDQAEVLEVIVPGDGSYRLTLTTAINSPDGRYTLTFETDSAATAEDRERLTRLAAARATRDRASALWASTAATAAERLAQVDQAQALASEAREQFAELRDRDGQAFAWNLLGQIERGRGSSADAEGHFRQALALWSETGNSWGRSTADLNLGLVLVDLAQDEAAIGAYQSSLAAALAARDPRLEAEARANLGIPLRRTGRIKEAVAEYEKAIALGLPSAECGAKAQLGVLRRETGEVEQARELLEQSLEVCSQAGQGSRRAFALNNLAVAYQDLGELAKARESLIAADQAAARLGDGKLQSLVALNQGNYYLRLGELDEAARYYGLAGGSQDRRLRADLLLQLGWLQSLQNRREEALATFDEARRLSTELADRWLQAASFHAVGVVEQKIPGRLASAREHLEAALALRRELADRPGLAASEGELGQVLLAQGELQPASAHLTSALAIAREIRDDNLAAVTLGRLAQLARDRGDLRQAKTWIAEAVDLFESLRSRLDDPQLRASLFGLRRSLYDLYIDILMRLDAAEPEGGHRIEAFHVAERARARGLVELLAEARVDVKDDLPPALRQQEREIESALSALGREIVKERSGPAQKPEQLAGLLARLAEKEKERKQLELDIRGASKRYAAVRYPSPLGLQEVQALLAERGNTALLEYCLGAERSYLFVVTAQELSVFPLAGAQSLEGEVRDALSSIVQADFRSRRAFPDQARRLYAKLLAPAEAVLAGSDHLLIVPDDFLFYLPFETLIRPLAEGEAGPAYVLGRWTVSYAPSATVLATLREGRRSLPAAERKDFVAFGDPVYEEPGAPPAASAALHERTRGPLERSARLSLERLVASGDEVNRIADLFSPREARTTVYLRDQATEEEVKTSPVLASAHRVHFAVHAYTDDQDPDHYGLFLSLGRSTTEDGVLQLWEVFNLKLNADLVVLSACSSGLGERLRGEGLIGMTRGFMYAGTPSVVASLWPAVDRSTAELMVSFYRHQETTDKAEALRQAKLEMLQKDPDLAPRYWAPFILIGDSK